MRRILLLVMFFGVSKLHGQQLRKISGKIVNSQTNEPLAGVVITLERNKVSTVSDKDGNFLVNATEDDYLITSYMGFQVSKTHVKTFNGTIKLQENIRELSQVTVIGYGTVDRKDVTGSVGEVNVADMAKAPVATFDRALAGRVAGVQVLSNEDQPGSAMNIVIRGGNSLEQSNSPLYVVDGFPMEEFSGEINPADIESISILKDASATAIYGSRGANGVVIIETKKGKVGLPQVSYRNSFGLSQVPKVLELMSPYEFVRYQVEKDPGNNEPIYFTKPNMTLEDYRSVAPIDWQDLLFKNGFMQTHNVLLSGGNPQTKYVVSGSVFDQTGVILNSGYSQYQGRIGLNQTISKKVKANLNVNYSNEKNYGQMISQQQSGSNSYSTYLMYQIWGYRPVMSSEFDLNIDLFDPEANDNRINPYVAAQNAVRQQNKSGLIVNTDLVYSISRNLELKIKGGIRTNLIENEAFYNSNTLQGHLSGNNPKGPNGLFRYIKLGSFLNENTLTYKKEINKSNQFDVLAGYTLQKDDSKTYGYNVERVPYEELGLSGMDLGSPTSVYSLISSNVLISYLGRATYRWKSRYFFTASIRADGSSKFSRENRWGYFPSGAFAWQMHKEKFLKNIAFINESKVRLSYGVTGNNRIGDFERFPSLNFPLTSYYSFDNGIPNQGLGFDNLGNSDLRWEKTAQYNIGYDVSVFKNKISISVDAYRKVTSDLLLNANIPNSTGFNSVFKNIGKIKNEGLEFSLSTKNIQKKSFMWTSDFNISFNRNKVLALNEGEDRFLTPVTWTADYNTTSLYITQIGGPASAFYGYEWDGVYQYDDFEVGTDGKYSLKPSVTTNGNPRENIQPGDIRYKDQNGDLTINDNDRIIIGRTLPIHVGGFSNNFTYKRISLNVFFQWSYGNDIFNANRIAFEGNQVNRNALNQYAVYANRWTEENQNETYFRIGGQGPNGVYSTRTIEDGSFLRLKTLQLSYSLPEAVCKRLKIKKIELNATGQNLYTWTKYSGMDPEVSVRNTARTPGFDYSAYPRSRQIVFGISISL
ncbi:SusC/RagA family TonB-linked outer membrane protein [Pseudopedobacter beijingensis]|uniref:SusC/RagA family TonB-linked outer membrane protein n=1 Tax=Pseudopedobacter beijingensis TaxID=1207056 RepID=A0ABW4IHA3_9SPHI